MESLFLYWTFSMLVARHHVYCQSCDLARANECTEQLNNLYNETMELKEKRTEEAKVRLCTLSLRLESDMMSTNISKCYQRATVSCDDTDPGTQAAKKTWDNITEEIHIFCDDDCQDYTEVQRCKEKVNLTAIGQEMPSEFCRTYRDTRDNCLSYLWGCDYQYQLFDSLFDSSYFKNYYQNVCLAGCSNLDETVRILRECYRYVEDPGPNNTCPAHRNFTACLHSYPFKPCKQFPSLITFHYFYDYIGNQRLCQDEACLKARNCQSEIQRQYDSTLGYYIIQSNETTHLRDLCLVPVTENEYKTCYNKYIPECTRSPKHPISAQWSEVIGDIHQLCHTECEDVITEVPKCHSFVEYEKLDSLKWSQFCRSHSLADSCARDRNCSLATSMLQVLIKPEVRGLIDSVCSSGCSNLQEFLVKMEKCFPYLDKTSRNCGHYDSFKTCIGEDKTNCPEADDIINFLSPGFSDLRIRCTTTTSTTTTTTTTTTTPTTTTTTTTTTTPTTTTTSTTATTPTTTSTTTTTITPTTTTTTTTTPTPTTTVITEPQTTTVTTTATTSTTTKLTTPSPPLTTVDVSECLTPGLLKAMNDTKIVSHTTTGEDSTLCIEMLSLASCLIRECPDLNELSRCVASLPSRIHKTLDRKLPTCKVQVKAIQQEMADYRALRGKPGSDHKRFFNKTCSGGGGTTSSSPALTSWTMTYPLAFLTSYHLVGAIL